MLILGLIQLTVALPLHAVLVRRHPEDLGLRPDGPLKPGPRDQVPPEARRQPHGMAPAQALQDTAFWTLTAAGGIEQLAAMTVSGHQVALIISRGFDPIFAAGIAGLVGLASLPGRFLLNHLSDRYNPRGILRLVLGTLGPLAAGWLYDRLGSYQLAFWLVTAAFVCASLLVHLTPRLRL